MYTKFSYIPLILLMSLTASCSDQSNDKAAQNNQKAVSVVAEPSSSQLAGALEPATDKDEKYKLNLHYSRISPSQETASKDGRIEVVEMFFYACPHCYKLEPTIEKWVSKLAGDIDFVRVPAIIGPTWAEQAKAFYIAEELGMADSVRKKLFESIHKDGKQYYNEYTLMTFFTEQGVDAERFLKLYESPEIMEKASEARVKTVRYGIRGVPAIIVNGKYYTATYYVRDHDEMLNVVDFLIEKERKEMLAAKSKV